jgi:alpha-glucosidase
MSSSSFSYNKMNTSFHTSSIVNPGKVIKIKKTKIGFEGKAAHAFFRIGFLSPSIINVKFSRTEVFEDFSYSVIAQSELPTVDLKEGANEIKLKSKALTVLIDVASSRLTFLDREGNLLNQDESGLGISWNGEQVTTYKKLQNGERFIGLGEKTGPLDRRGHGYQHWNTDAFAYGTGSDPLYCSIPFYIGVHDGGVYGIFFDNTHKTFFNFGASNNRFASFSADAGEMNYYFIHGNSVAEIIKHYSWLTGKMEMPPLWSLGFQQCRYSYYPDKEVSTLASTFRDKKIPADAIVLDIHYMDAYKIFSWHPTHFPEPDKLITELKSKGFEVVVMCDPGIKVEKGYDPYDDGVKMDAFIQYADGKNYEGNVWPGWCHFPDFTKPKTREWWAKWMKTYAEKGIHGYWNDMNEIATWGQMLPENIVFDFEGHKSTSRRGRNVYGLMMAKASFEGAKKNLKGKRPFNLTRSGFSGIQRYAAVWTGDNVSYDEHMMLGVRLVNSMGLSGIPFAGYDVGGFVGEASSKLFARWITIGSLSPFFRGHTMINTRDSEPWSYGEETEQISRNYIRFRYKLLPYIYSCFYEASQTGMPVQRSLAILHPQEKKIYDHTYQHQYFFGPSILVCPVESSKDLVKVFLPEGTWYYLFTGKTFVGDQEIVVECPPHKLPIFIKGSAIIPMHDVGDNTKFKSETLYIHIYRGAQNTRFDLYADDGDTYQFQKGEYALRTIEYKPSKSKIVIGAVEGDFKPLTKKIKILLHGFSEKAVVISKKKIPLRKESLEFFLPLEKFDPLYDPDTMGNEDVLEFEIPYTLGEVVIGV